jgi:hypothetical protein
MTMVVAACCFSSTTAVEQEDRVEETRGKGRGTGSGKANGGEMPSGPMSPWIDAVTCYVIELVSDGSQLQRHVSNQVGRGSLILKCCYTIVSLSCGFARWHGDRKLELTQSVLWLPLWLCCGDGATSCFKALYHVSLTRSQLNYVRGLTFISSGRTVFPETWCTYSIYIYTPLISVTILARFRQLRWTRMNRLL